ncbi:Uncharacterized protein dnm_037940 [Desulfonema magnum]|uniref:Uncharacterized protein n=1 Tax=Desulfonema magnum TaxID=45655 RepID=A0A975BLG4_9BACT|nr:Uncharacterized protein dnm_037940 [Desulfonema magnum]
MQEKNKGRSDNKEISSFSYLASLWYLTEMIMTGQSGEGLRGSENLGDPHPSEFIWSCNRFLDKL